MISSQVVKFKAVLWSISSTFYARIFYTKVLFLPNVTREKHRHLRRKALWYVKHARKMLMKLRPVNNNNHINNLTLWVVSLDKLFFLKFHFHFYFYYFYTFSLTSLSCIKTLPFLIKLDHWKNNLLLSQKARKRSKTENRRRELNICP